jgi:hypothetical protein
MGPEGNIRDCSAMPEAPPADACDLNQLNRTDGELAAEARVQWLRVVRLERHSETVETRIGVISG